MTMITETMTIADVYEIPELKELKKYLLYRIEEKNPLSKGFKESMQLKDIGMVGWNCEGAILGIQNLIRVKDCNRGMHFIYSEEECASDQDKRDVGFMYLEPEQADESKPYVVLCAGGAYQFVCTMIESAAVGAVLNKLGYKVFLVNYRVGGIGVMPKPVEDLAAVLRYIRSHADEFGINPDDYIVGGFSAGGNLTCVWGMENVGYKKYDLPKPKALFPVYPVADLVSLSKEEERKFFLSIMLGENYTDEMVRTYSTIHNITDGYPPCYAVCCEDDDSVDYHDSVKLNEALKQLGIPSKLELGKSGGHGFGLGCGTDVDGWVLRATAFEQSLSKY